MSANSDKATGLAHQVAGKIKQGVGKALGDNNLEAKGAGQEARGKIQKTVGEAKSGVKHVADKVKKAVDDL